MSKVSIFKSITQVSNPELQDMFSYLCDTRDGKWQDIVIECRNIKDKVKRNEFKKTMPTTSLSGEFLTRNDRDLIEHNGFLAMDLDDVDNIGQVKRTLEDDKYVYSVFVSTSGYGLRAIFAIDPERHADSFVGISEYLFTKYGIISDPNGKNVSKPYVVSFDPFLYISPDTTPVFKKYIKETPIKQIQDFVYTASDFHMVLKEIVGRGVNICESYNDWLKVGFAISEQFGEEGRQYFDAISRQSSKYKSKQTDDQYKACLKARGTTKANISTFYYLAKINNVNICSENTKIIVKTTKSGKKSGLSKNQIIENLSKFSNITGADKLVSDIFESPASFNEEDETVVHQLESFILNNYDLSMNEITGYVEDNLTPLNPNALNSIFISAKKAIPKLDYQLMIRLLKSDFVPSYNPFYKYFGSDGIPIRLPSNPVQNEGFSSPLIDKLASCISNDNPAYTVFFLRKWLVGIISAMHKVHSPLLLCLLGPQNTGKTEFFRRLLPKELGMYYAESKLDKEKDDEILMTENILIMDDELGGKSKQESRKLNDLTSKQYFSLRRPYGDHNEKILRLAVLCGTSNYKQILTDPTGNRRIIPIWVDNIDKDLYNSIDKAELFKECFRLYKEGFDWRITYIDIPYLNNDMTEYKQVVKETELLNKYFAPGDDVKLSTTEILVEIEMLTRQKLNMMLLGSELEANGFIRKTVRVNLDKTVKKWFVVRTNRKESIFSDGNVDRIGLPNNDQDEDAPF